MSYTPGQSQQKDREGRKRSNVCGCSQLVSHSIQKEVTALGVQIHYHSLEYVQSSTLQESGQTGYRLWMLGWSCLQMLNSLQKISPRVDLKKKKSIQKSINIMQVKKKTRIVHNIYRLPAAYIFFNLCGQFTDRWEEI